ncbi:MULTISPECIES: GNAT family N-acetyltransferase [Actinoplanes]|uniref:Acetyltransferase n=1 Tax=Actinoplanes awajinensis subsp. mycoplanecinus TaxID=135947 RepID=A0A0X3UPA1_9ACTN|nr:MULTISPECIES: GNAT family N-acetyltransferase [Actinoplanes]KUL34429.1 acetyltransferase [Actinoplanes awajinensis subsp. mycoplanecinus]
MGPVAVRSYRPSDHAAGRRLWTELTRQQHEMYGETDDDGGAGFEEYLTRLDLSGLWVADHADDGVIGMVGLIMRARAGEVEPVIVTITHRHKGVGRTLLQHVATEAKKRNMLSLTISPASRNVEAIRSLHAAGYDVVSSIELTMDLDRHAHAWQEEGLELQGLPFRN